MIKENKLLLSLKLSIDFFLALILFIILLPLTMLISIIVFVDSGFPIFFKQKRIGLNGKLFVMYKFRTMSNKSYKLAKKYHCYEGDKRITYPGKYLRKFSLDELPQLVNIITGQMSFVGPRPAIHDEFIYEKIDPKLSNIISLRTKVKPGITGYAQTKSRNDLDWNQKLIFDKEYISLSPKRRFLQDIIIVLKTFSEILFTKGAYDKRTGS